MSATLLIKIAFKPKHRRAVKLTRTLTAPPIQPVISSVQFVGQPSNPKIIVRGKGLGKRPARNPSTSPAGQNGCPSQTGNYGFDYGTNLSITDSTGDSTGDWSAGRHLPSFGELDCIGIVPTKFTSGEVDFGLGSFYTGRYPQFSLSPGDDVQVVVNGAVIDVHVQYGPPVTS